MERIAGAVMTAQGMIWERSYKADPEVLPLANRHYNRQTPDSPQFVPPGRSLVLKTPDRRAFWVTSWPFAEHVRHAWAGAWVCSAFRNEGAFDGERKASEMIRSAVACTLWRWPEPPRVEADGGPVAMVTFVNAAMVRRSRTPGRCFRKAGFRVIGETAGGLIALGLGVDNLPAAEPCVGEQFQMFGRVAAREGHDRNKPPQDVDGKAIKPGDWVELVNFRGSPEGDRQGKIVELGDRPFWSGGWRVTVEIKGEPLNCRCDHQVRIIARPQAPDAGVFDRLRRGRGIGGVAGDR